MKKNRIVLYLFNIFIIFGYSLFSATLDFDDFNGTGKFINAKGGHFSSSSPFDNVIGTLYVSGDFGEKNYSDSFKTHVVFTALEFNGLVVSDSPLYSAEIGTTPLTNDYYFVLTRNVFDEGLIENRKLGRLLELGYFDDGSLLKDWFYNGIKNFYSVDELNLAIDETFGTKVFPLITKQSLEIFTNTNATLINSISEIDKYTPIDRIKIIANYTYQEVNVDSTSDYDGYETSNSIISFGVEKKLSDNFKIGTMGTFVDSSTDMDSYKGSRDDFLYLGHFFLVYSDDSLAYTSMLTLGGDDTDTYRYNYSPLGDFINESNMTSYFLGLNNSIYKKFKIGKFDISPGFELNAIVMKQGSLNENGDYGLEIGKINTFSVKPGIGLKLGKSFNITHKTQLNLEAKGVNYIEIGEPYKEMDVTLKAISDQKGTIEEYDYHQYHLDFSLKQNLKSSNGLDLSLVEKWILFENQDRFEFSLGLELIYVF